jgi:tRNA(Ile)-lysidine synthase
MALLLLLREHLRHRRVRTPLLAITVDHRMRPESSDEAAQLAQLCTERWGVHHVTRQCQWSQARPEPRESKFEEEARRFRYELLRDACAQHGVRCLFVAHTLGDQLETTLFRLGRASGVNGLAGMANVSTFVAAEDAEEEEKDSGLLLESEEAAVNKAAARA